MSRDTMPSDWPGLMPRSNTGVISPHSGTVCGEGWFLWIIISELVPKSASGVAGSVRGYFLCMLLPLTTLSEIRYGCLACQQDIRRLNPAREGGVEDETLLKELNAETGRRTCWPAAFGCVKTQ